MSVQQTWSEAIPQDTTELGQQLLAEDSVYRFVGDNANEMLDMEDFYEMYSVSGRGAVHPFMLALVTLFQFLENIPDRVAAQWVVLRIDWKYALHVSLSDRGFNHTTLSAYRKRLVEHSKERVIFDRVLQCVQSHGFLKKRKKQRTDSTHVIGCVARLSRLETVWETIRVTLGALKTACSAWYQQRVPAVFDEMYRERQSDWHLSAEQVKAEMRKAGADGYWLLDLVTEHGPFIAQALPEVAVLQDVLSQQFERREGRVRARKSPTGGKKRSPTPTSQKRGTRKSAAPSGSATRHK
jgi:transposase